MIVYLSLVPVHISCILLVFVFLPLYIAIDPYRVDGMAIHRPIMRKSLQPHLDLVRSANQLNQLVWYGYAAAGHRPALHVATCKLLYCTPYKESFSASSETPSDAYTSLRQCLST
jgi:hypothetical protein